MKKNLPIYVPAVLAVFAIKIFYRTADSDQLSWILAPTTWWVQILSGIPFEKAAQVGYVGHDLPAACVGGQRDAAGVDDSRTASYSDWHNGLFLNAFCYIQTGGKIMQTLFGR